MGLLFFRIRQFLAFYWKAVTKYQLHSPFVFELAQVVLEDPRWFYAFQDIEDLREQMLSSDARLNMTDYGAGAAGNASQTRTITVAEATRRMASRSEQGWQLFQLVDWASPKTMLELGTSVGIGALYMASAARNAQFISLEGSGQLAGVARANVERLGVKNLAVRSGPFEETLPNALHTLGSLDFVFLDGNHRLEPTLRYFETILPYAHDSTVFVFDDTHWSPDMATAWERLKAHPRTTLTVDFFELSLLFINPAFREQQHWSVVRAWLKPWRFY